MIIDLIKLEKSPYEFRFTLSPEEIDLTDEAVLLKGETLVEGVLTKHIAETEVAGKITADIEIECTRCLTPAEKKLEIPFEAAFIAAENFSEAKEKELNSEDLNASAIESDEINLTELVREQILLSLPEQFFCKEDCKGLCQKCGVNLNLINCNCLEKEIDPRWNSLRDFQNRK